jgi:L,D-peptidoglycan transpeptidase YkuD (ErfK/YbiS/YcfS/YnhG family)
MIHVQAVSESGRSDTSSGSLIIDLLLSVTLRKVELRKRRGGWLAEGGSGSTMDGGWGVIARRKAKGNKTPQAVRAIHMACSTSAPRHAQWAEYSR